MNNIEEHIQLHLKDYQYRKLYKFKNQEYEY